MYFNAQKKGFLYKDFIYAFVNIASIWKKNKTVNCDVQAYQFYEESGHKMRFPQVLLSINHGLGNTRCKINSCLGFFFFLTFFLIGKIDTIIEN